MSYYTCIDLIDSALTHSKPENDSLLQKIRFSFLGNERISSAPLSQEDRTFLRELRHKLTQRIHEENYTDLNSDIIDIRKYFDKTKPNNEGLKFILDDLVEIEKRYQAELTCADQSSILACSEQYKKFQTSKYRIADIRQGRSYKLGNSEGECYGFTHAMVDATISPYKNPIDAVDLNERIHKYQRVQSSRTLDQDRIKRTRLTREHFCPDFNQQAKALLSIATRYQGKELSVYKRNNSDGHACYLSRQDDGKIRYMDPNHGAYLFDNADDFVEFYVVASTMDKKAGFNSRFYSLNQLEWDPERKLTESKSFLGKIRSFLTGSKYQDGPAAQINRSFVFAMGAGFGALFGAAIGTVVPIIGTMIGACIGGVLGGAGAVSLSSGAEAMGHRGLLGVFHYVRDRLHNFMKKSAAPSPTQAPQNEAVPNHVICNKSTTDILLSLGANETKYQEVSSNVESKQQKTSSNIKSDSINDEDTSECSEIAYKEVASSIESGSTNDEDTSKYAEIVHQEASSSIRP